MEEIKIEAVVKFNDGEAFVLSRKPIFVYELIGKYLWAEDSGFVNCFHYDRPSPGFFAFGGRKFELPMVDGSVTKCYGQWWDGGMNAVAEMLGVELCHVTNSTKEKLIKCYVYSGCSGNVEAIKKLRDEYAGCVYPYNDYRKIVNADSLRHKAFMREWKLEKANKSLIKEVKKKHQLLMEAIK